MKEVKSNAKLEEEIESGKIDSIKYYKFVKDLQKLADEQNLNLKITHIVKDGEVIIVFRREFEKFGMRYEKIDHLTHDDILVWVDSNIFVRKEMGWLKTAMDSIKEEREREEKEKTEMDGKVEILSEEEEKERSEQEKKKFIKI